MGSTLRGGLGERGPGLCMSLGLSTLCAGCMAVQFNIGRSEKKLPWPHKEKPAPNKSRSGSSKTKTLQIFRRHLVRRNTFSQEIKVTNWYQPLPSHQKVPEAAFPGAVTASQSTDHMASATDHPAALVLRSARTKRSPAAEKTRQRALSDRLYGQHALTAE